MSQAPFGMPVANTMESTRVRGPWLPMLAFRAVPLCAWVLAPDEPGSSGELEILAMKTTDLLCFLLFASLTWGQSLGPSVVNGQPQPLRLPSNTQHASAAPLGEQQSLLGTSAYSSAKGERPLWEVASLPRHTTPLAD